MTINEKNKLMEDNRIKAKELARQKSYEYYCEKMKATMPTTDEYFRPLRKVIEGYDCYQVTDTNFVIPYDENQVYPMQEIERIIVFKR